MIMLCGMAVTNSKRHYLYSVVSFSATACKLSFFAFRNPIVIVLYIVILDIYKIYNFVTKLTAILLSLRRAGACAPLHLVYFI
jgi:hypothetical protein